MCSPNYQHGGALQDQPWTEREVPWGTEDQALRDIYEGNRHIVLSRGKNCQWWES